MQVRILFFGVLRELAGRSGETLDLHGPATLKDVLDHYEERIPRLQTMSNSIAMSINREFARPEAKLNDGDEVAFLPPVSGGSGDGAGEIPDRNQRQSLIIWERIDTPAILAQLKHPSDGAAILFEGVVRDNSRGRRTLYLDYEAYEEMAVKQMDALVEQAQGQFAIRRAAIVHRLGRLEIGEVSVLIVVVSAHRAAAFDACRWLIDTLKRTVPIWKKEYFEDGAVWADGEPFPAEITGLEGSHSKGPASK